METDAYDVGIWTVPIQKGQSIAYLSKDISSQHQVMYVHDKELLALIMSMTRWG